MPYSVYIIYSAKLDKYYIGYTQSIEQRLLQHNEGFSTFTSGATNWIIEYAAEFSSREEAHKRELDIKRKKSRKYIEGLISSVGHALHVPNAFGKEVVPLRAGYAPQKIPRSSWDFLCVTKK